MAAMVVPAANLGGLVLAAWLLPPPPQARPPTIVRATRKVASWPLVLIIDGPPVVE
jgi:hypothetical protein